MPLAEPLGRVGGCGDGPTPSRPLCRRILTRRVINAKRYAAASGANRIRSELLLCDLQRYKIDEIPAAYKAIDVVMEDASDLVTVLHELRQFLNVKGQ
ncbi:RtcB family protein [Rhodococcus sp. WMMA185]|uniref:RtcB family protein n=1 Tax=Rhodococcus sp. WMMA185 TaxID=679318 RepID=UPI0012F4C0B2|nr:RtcB family protein [Rhodococcus sp. WMMA185]